MGWMRGKTKSSLQTSWIGPLHTVRTTQPLNMMFLSNVANSPGSDDQGADDLEVRWDKETGARLQTLLLSGRKVAIATSVLRPTLPLSVGLTIQRAFNTSAEAPTVDPSKGFTSYSSKDELVSMKAPDFRYSNGEFGIFGPLTTMFPLPPVRDCGPGASRCWTFTSASLTMAKAKEICDRVGMLVSAGRSAVFRRCTFFTPLTTRPPY